MRGRLNHRVNQTCGESGVALGPRAGYPQRSAYAYTDKHVGPPERIGNKGGGLANRLRAVMAGKK
jgi:hypothetical protein